MSDMFPRYSTGLLKPPPQNPPFTAFLSRQCFPPRQGAQQGQGGRSGCTAGMKKDGLPSASRQKAGAIQISSEGAAQLSPCPINPI